MKKTFNDLYSDFFSHETKKKSTPPKKEPDKKPLRADDMKKMMDDLETLNSEMNQILLTSQDKITKKMDSLDLKDDSSHPFVNEQYTDAADLVESYILGQKEAVHALDTAFKRPYYHDIYAPVLNTILLCGPKGSGKHTMLQRFNEILYANQHLQYPRPSWLDLSKIQDEATLIQDLYSALQKERSLIVLENIDACPAVFLTHLQTLCQNGSLPLKSRYILQNQKLVSADRILKKDLVSQITGKQHYFIFMSHLSLSKTKQKLGNQFLSVIHEYIETKPLDTTVCLQLLKKDLALFEQKLTSKFALDLHFDKDALSFLAQCCSKENGYHAVQETLDALYLELTDYLFKHTDQTKVTLTCIDGYLAVDKANLFLKKADSSDELAEIQKEMDEIVGLQEVKDYIYALKDMVAVANKRKAQGLKSAEISMHMIFTGNPGTGKTTMARLMARSLKALGVLKNGQLVEVTRADLVASYVGQTAPKTKQVIEASLGGVLFIDEAYSLYRGKEDSFGLEAIDMLVKGMEDYRDEFVVVLAGYSKEMKDFLTANSGLKSRFPNIIEFPDYTKEELLAIAQSIAKSKDYEIAEEAQAPLLAYFDKVQKDSASRSGNGRLARNVVEEAILKQSSRLMQEPEASLTLLTVKDFCL